MSLRSPWLVSCHCRPSSIGWRGVLGLHRCLNPCSGLTRASVDRLLLCAPLQLTKHEYTWFQGRTHRGARASAWEDFCRVVPLCEQYHVVTCLIRGYNRADPSRRSSWWSQRSRSYSACTGLLRQNPHLRCDSSTVAATTPVMTIVGAPTGT